MTERGPEGASDLGREIARSVRPDWNELRSQLVESATHRRRKRRVAARVAIGSLAVAVIVTTAFFAWPRPIAPREQPIAALPSAPGRSTTLRFADGSSASPVGSDGRLHLVATQPRLVVVDLVSGAGRFHIVEDDTRVFRVTSARVTVEAFGATFGAARFETSARIDVIDGSVRVSWDDQQRVLGAGDGGLFPPAVPVEPAAQPKAPAEEVRPHPAHIAKESWRDLARDGDYDKAYAALARPDAPVVRDEAEELLLAADVKRLSHHPAEAVAPLRKILSDHARDPRASLAAFTLGRVLLEELGNPREAAGAFADAERLAPDGPMAEDAVAREVEALSRAGDSTGAQRLAEEYVGRFPEGRKLRSVRRFGGLE